MIKVPKIATGIRLPQPIMQVIDEAAARWFCDRGQAITLIVQEWEQFRTKQLSLIPLDPPQETDDPAGQMRRLKVQELPGFIPNDVVKVNNSHPPQSIPSTSSGRADSFHLGTGPGDEVGE